jgi:hypothetical protein
LQGGLAVVGDVDGHRVAAQPAGDGVGEELFVLHDQHAHPFIMPVSAVSAA